MKYIKLYENFNEEEVVSETANKIKSDLEEKGLKGNILVLDYQNGIGDMKNFNMKSELNNDFLIVDVANSHVCVYFKNTPQMQTIAIEIYENYGAVNKEGRGLHSTMYGTYPDKGYGFNYDFPNKTEGSEYFQRGGKLNTTDPFVGVSFIPNK
jgi:hypothetical protein